MIVMALESVKQLVAADSRAVSRFILQEWSTSCANHCR
jgi:hypothetical protein